MEDLNYETIQGYHNRHRTLKEGHPFDRLNDYEYLRSIGAAAISPEDKKLHPTAAGMLMFFHLKCLVVIGLMILQCTKRFEKHWQIV